MINSRYITNNFTVAVVICAASTIFANSAVHASSVTYKYDSLGRIVEAIYSTGLDIKYSYDPAGNRTTVVTTGGLP